jgi:predicted aconitase/predicted aconitase with swiveling domain
MSQQSVLINHYTSGSAKGGLIYSDTPLSFWGGVNPMTGEIIDRHHPLSGESLSGKILAIPAGRGSCTGSSVLLEIILNGRGPLAIVLQQADEILILGALIAQLVFQKTLPIVSIGEANFKDLRQANWASIEENRVLTARNQNDINQRIFTDEKNQFREEPTRVLIKLSPKDEEILAGKHGIAKKVAMQIILKMADIQGATELIDVVQAHIDGCIYTGSASLRFANQLRDWGGKVCVPTTLNAISVDQQRWRELGVDPAFGEPASALADSYVAMGCKNSFTCAPYILDSAPTAGQNIVWAESNAVVYANSVIGARTAKYADFLDICIALTGRAPNASCHLDVNRYATIVLSLPAKLNRLDDSFYPLLGYLVGHISASRIPAITGLEMANPTVEDLKAFGAAFATTSSAPMFHIVNVTPEAPTIKAALGDNQPLYEHSITHEELKNAWHELNNSTEKKVDLIALGNPHFSASECSALAQLLKGKKRHPATQMIVTTGKATYLQAKKNGDINILEDFGVSVLCDTCWCMIGEPIVPKEARVLMTNSGKYAHYAPGLTGRKVRFGSLAQCARVAMTGVANDELPPWLASDLS